MYKHVYKTKPYKHQKKAISLSWDAEAFGLLMEQGTGKSKVIVDTVAMQYGHGMIDALLVVAPNGVQRGWLMEHLPYHMTPAVPYRAVWYVSQPTKTHEKRMEAIYDPHFVGLRVLTVNYEAFSSKACQAYIARFLKTYRTLWVCDESHRIKNIKASRTEVIINLSPRAKTRRILTGTPVTKSPLDAYSQMLFLDDAILGYDSFTAFTSHFAQLEPDNAGAMYMVRAQIMRSCMAKCKGNVENAKRMAEKFKPQVIQKDDTGKPMFRNMEELRKLMAPHTYRVLKKDCLDLPDKVYVKRYVELTGEQRQLYNTMRDEFIAEYQEHVMAAPLAMSRMMRLQQITGGFFTTDEGTVIPIGKTNPKMEELKEILEDTDGKVIIWARFKEELQLIANTLDELYGMGTCARYWGNGYSATKKDEEKRRFIESDACQYFVSQQSSGGTGLDGLQKVTTVEVYFSNEFALGARLQSEDRAHRSGMRESLLIIDLEAMQTLDAKVINTLRAKKELADEVTGDAPTKWI